MNPRERIATILFIEQIKQSKIMGNQNIIYTEVVLRKEAQIKAKEKTLK